MRIIALDGTYMLIKMLCVIKFYKEVMCSITDHRANRVALLFSFQISGECCHRRRMYQHGKE